MTKVLFVESGIIGGGSFESLYQYLRSEKRQTRNVAVAFLSKTRFIGMVRDLGIEVHLLYDPLLTRDASRLNRIVLWRTLRFAEIVKPSLGLMVLKKVHRRLINTLYQIIIHNNYRLLYLNTQINRDMFGVFVSMATGIPCISHLRSLDGRTFTYEKAKLANHKIHTFVANSIATRDYWISKGVNQNQIEVVLNAIPDLNIKALDLRKEWRLPSSTNFIIGCVARLISWKGQDFLLRSFAVFLRNNPGGILFLVGDGPCRGQLEKKARKLDIADAVIFTGFEQRAKEIIGALDVLVLPSRYEPFGRVLLEGMALGIPVIGANCFGIAEIINHGEDGILVPYNDDYALADALQTLASDETMRVRLIRKAREKVRKTFNMDHYTKQIDEIIARAMKLV